MRHASNWSMTAEPNNSHFVILTSLSVNGQNAFTGETGQTDGMRRSGTATSAARLCSDPARRWAFQVKLSHSPRRAVRLVNRKTRTSHIAG
jgi:hypothetical protein